MKWVFVIILLCFFILFSHTAYGQQPEMRNIHEIILDPDTDEPLIGASIFIKGTEIGTTSDIDGKFKLEIPKNENVVLLISYGCPSFELKTKQKKSYYRIRPNPYRSVRKKINFRYGLSKITKQENNFKSNFQLGFIYDFTTQSRFRIGTGIFYNNTNVDFSPSNFGSIGVPLNFKYRKRNFYLKTGGAVNYIFHQKSESLNLDKFHPAINSQLGYEINYKMDVELGAKYVWLKSGNKRFNLINPFLGISWNLN